MLYFLTKTANNDTMVAANRFIVDVSPANIVYRFDKKFDGDNSLGIGNYFVFCTHCHRARVARVARARFPLVFEERLNFPRDPIGGLLTPRRPRRPSEQRRS